MAKRAAVVGAAGRRGHGPRLLKAGLDEAGTRPELERGKLPRDQPFLDHALAVACRQNACPAGLVEEMASVDVEEDARSPRGAVLFILVKHIPLVPEHDGWVEVGRHVVQRGRLVLLVVKVHVDTKLVLQAIVQYHK